MIIGNITNKGMYLGTHPRMKQAFEFVDACFARGTAPGRYEIDGDNLFAMVFRYAPQENENPRYETHDEYIDLQCMLSGSETHWYISRKNTTDPTPYNTENDITFYPFSGEGSKLSLSAGDFAVYFPQDAHLPGMADGSAEECIRIVVKIKY